MGAFSLATYWPSRVRKARSRGRSRRRGLSVRWWRKDVRTRFLSFTINGKSNTRNCGDTDSRLRRCGSPRSRLMGNRSQLPSCRKRKLNLKRKPLRQPKRVKVKRRRRRRSLPLRRRLQKHLRLRSLQQRKRRKRQRNG